MRICATHKCLKQYESHWKYNIIYYAWSKKQINKWINEHTSLNRAESLFRNSRAKTVDNTIQLCFDLGRRSPDANVLHSWRLTLFFCRSNGEKTIFIQFLGSGEVRGLPGNFPPCRNRGLPFYYNTSLWIRNRFFPSALCLSSTHFETCITVRIWIFS